MDENAVRTQVQLALEAATHRSQPITTLREFLNFVREECLAAKACDKHETVIIDIWNQRAKLTPSTPAEASIRNSPDVEGRNALHGGPDSFPLLDEETECFKVHLYQPASALFGYAVCKYHKEPGSYIRADSMRNNKMKPGPEGLLVIQWELAGGDPNRTDHTATHTACHVLDDEKAKSIGMDVDIVLGTDCEKELVKQDHYLRNISRQNAAILEDDIQQPVTRVARDLWPLPNTSMARIASPGIDSPRFNIHFHGSAFHGPVFIGEAGLSSASEALEASGVVSTKRTSAYAPEYQARRYAVPTVDGNSCADALRGKRKAAGEHEAESVDRAKRHQI
ncbi:hypothetical protein JX265_001668 [Neoarthrinium moseri]|uniref:Uncharacterized protein n=1 Tax=Neoarthrinium moseri TaxID=1658444 RepID=A0A9P9WVF8_9PEZI|nr:hypothetical protein JX265_001668 [Neoarthrinium moseri]